MKTTLAATYVGLAILANWLASKYLITIPLTGGLMAPAGVYCIGAILVMRDWYQQIAGLWRSLTLIYVAGISSYAAGVIFGWTDLQRVALASLVAFTVSETLEAAVFTPLRKRRLTFGVAASATIGNVVDSWVFLTIAFGSSVVLVPPFFWGQFWGKTQAIVIGVALTAARRRKLPVTA